MVTIARDGFPTAVMSDDMWLAVVDAAAGQLAALRLPSALTDHEHWQLVLLERFLDFSLSSITAAPSPSR